MILEISFLTALALLVAWLVVGLGRRVGPGPGAGLWFFFLLLLLAGWAASRWLLPSGPAVFDVYLLGPAVATVLLALVVLAVAPASERSVRGGENSRQAEESPQETRTRHTIEAGATAAFWIAVLGLALVVAAGYWFG